jgi:hypothetical protein
MAAQASHERYSSDSFPVHAAAGALPKLNLQLAKVPSVQLPPVQLPKVPSLPKLPVVGSLPPVSVPKLPQIPAVHLPPTPKLPLPDPQSLVPALTKLPTQVTSSLPLVGNSRSGG